MSGVVGAGQLLRLALRRDRVLAPVLVLLFGGLASTSAAATVGLYTSPRALESAVDAANSSPALVALYGQVHGSLGALASMKMLTTAAVFVALVPTFLVRRHTRTDEETGRFELLGGGVVSRAAPLLAAVTESALVVAALSALGALGFAASGLPLAGSLALGTAWLVTGLSFTAVAAVAVQLTASARTAAALAGAVLAATFVLRAVGDVAGDGPLRLLSWLSPFGWGQLLRPFADERWAVLLAPAVAVPAGLGLALLLRSRRDLGAGLVPDRTGPARTTMGTPLALAWRLQRGAVLGWSLALLLGGVLVGGVATSAGSFLDSPAAQDLVRSLGGEGSLADAFLAVEFGVLGLVVAGFGVALTLRLMGEETQAHAELALSTATTRLAWLASHVVLALAGTAGVLLLLGIGAGLADGAARGDLTGSLGRVVAAALVQVPAVWVVVAVAVLLYGTSARLGTAAWGVLAACLLLGQFAELLHLPRVVTELNPFSHLPLLPGGSVDAAPLVALVAVAGAALVVGATAFRHRDIG